jgi:ABC-type multidrug transport system fused ATPase/permease subunit
MTTDTALIEKREELKRRLAAGEYKTLVDVILAWANSVIQKISRRSKPLPIWLITVILSLVLGLVFNVGIYIADDWSTFRNFFELTFGYRPSTLSIILLMVLGSVGGIASVVIINQYIRRVFALWHSQVLDATESVGSLDEFEYWLGLACNRRLQLLWTVIGGLLSGLNLVAVINAQLGLILGYGFISTIIMANMLGWPLVYLLLTVVLLSATLRRYDLKLFASDPSSSELVSHLSSELGFFVYYVGVYAAIVTIVFALSGVLASFGILLVLIYWLPIIAIFILNQTSLSSIIRRVKWKTLNEIQAKVEKLQTSKNFGNQETMDSIKRLMDYHDRVKATRDSALDFRAYLGFINSLLLPLLAFILGNLDLLLKLSARKP